MKQSIQIVQIGSLDKIKRAYTLLLSEKDCIKVQNTEDDWEKALNHNVRYEALTMFFYTRLVDLIGTNLKTNCISIKFHYPHNMKDKIDIFYEQNDSEIKKLIAVRNKIISHCDLIDTDSMDTKFTYEFH